jgi:replicative DNA helicase
MARQFSIADQFADPQAEAQLLATIYANPETFYEVIDLVPVETWTYYQKDFRAVAEAIGTEQPLPVLELNQPPTHDPEPLAKRIADLYQKRMAAHLLEQSLGQLHSDATAGELISNLESGLVEVQNSIREAQMGQMVNVPSLFDNLLKDLSELHEEVKKKGKSAVGLPTGFPTLDHHMGGLQKGIHLLAAEPGQGKTTFALQIARKVSQQGYPAIFVSFEESLDRLALKSLCSIGSENGERLNIKRYSEGWGDPRELEPHIATYGPHLKNLHLIQGTKHLTVSQVKAKALQLMHKTGTDKCLIVVDYLQRWAAFQRESGFTDYRHTVRELAAELRELSLRLRSPIVIISSQNRMGQGSNRLSSLKESGDLEYDADSALFLTKSEERMPQGTARMVDLHIEKNRYGDKGQRVDLVFHPDFGLFKEE